MSKSQFIFFDVGNTLLFPNRARILASLPAELHPTLERWQNLERRTKHEFDSGMASGKLDHGFWWTFHTYLLQEIGKLNDGIRDALVEDTRGTRHQTNPRSTSRLSTACNPDAPPGRRVASIFTDV